MSQFAHPGVRRPSDGDMLTREQKRLTRGMPAHKVSWRGAESARPNAQPRSPLRKYLRRTAARAAFRDDTGVNRCGALGFAPQDGAQKSVAPSVNQSDSVRATPDDWDLRDAIRIASRAAGGYRSLADVC